RGSGCSLSQTDAAPRRPARLASRSQLVRKKPCDGEYLKTRLRFKKRRERHREYLRDHRGHFERVKPHFFAEDLCPSNATRFPLLFEDSADDLPLDHQSPESSPGTL